MASLIEPTPNTLRPGDQVMQLSRMGCFHQSRLSFMRVLLRKLKRENWQFSRPLWQIDDQGVGVATYQAQGPDRTYTLVAFAHDLPAEKRSDRVIAEAWDSTFTLFDGVPTAEDIERLSQNVPLQEAGRISDSEFVLARANRSVRLFEYVIDCLSNGEQPERGKIDQTGYLMRTSAVYGASKFGAADRQIWADRPEFNGSFQPELLSVWLIRAYVLDLVEHLAQARSPNTAVALEPQLRRCFGVGNSTGLGMAPFLLTHPALIDAWVNARETALATVREIALADAECIQVFLNRVSRAHINAEQWRVDHEGQRAKIKLLQQDFTALNQYLDNHLLSVHNAWDKLVRWGEKNLSLEGQEQLVSLLLEPYGDLIDSLSTTMCADEKSYFKIDGSMKVEYMTQMLQQHYNWALKIDYTNPKHDARVWYVSEEKLEPRLGERHEEPIEPYEQPLCPARDAKRAYQSLQSYPPKKSIAEFLMRHPEHRHIIRRVQLTIKLEYAEVRDNTIDASMLPIDLLRCKLAFFGATKFDPRSDRWVRITMYQGAPFPYELASMDPDECAYPPLATQ